MKKETAVRIIPALLICAGMFAACKPAPGSYQCSGADRARSESPTTSACFVKVKTVLRMRAKPDLKAKVIDVLPDNARVIPGERSGPVIRIRDRRGRWTKVSWNDRSGWVFGGFLTNRGREPHEMRRTRTKWPKVCEKDFHAPACLAARENNVMKNHPGLHVRRGNSLVLKLQNGKQIAFRDRPNIGESTIIHNLRGYYEDLALFYLELSFYEGGSYLLVDAKTGRRYRLAGKPRVTPKRDRIITVDFDPHEAYGTNSMEVWAARAGGLKRIYKRKFDSGQEGGPSFAGWDGGGRPKIEMYHRDGGILRRFILMETRSGAFQQTAY